MMYRTVTQELNEKALSTIVLLAGRGGRAEGLLHIFGPHLKQCRLIAVQPIEEWYPMPNGANDQVDAVEGLGYSIPQLKSFLKNLERQFDIPSDNISLIGFSAGAVMALQMVMCYEDAYCSVIAHSAAILSPEAVLTCKNNTPILLLHSKDDDCFSWDERYVPMKNALVNNNYKVTFCEKAFGGHVINEDDVKMCCKFITSKIIGDDTLDSSSV